LTHTHVVHGHKRAIEVIQSSARYMRLTGIGSHPDIALLGLQ
jgi:hypothetical protein